MNEKNNYEFIKTSIQILMKGCANPTHALLRDKTLAISEILTQFIDLDSYDRNNLLKDLDVLASTLDLLDDLYTPVFGADANPII